jgi:hypothetical protein
MRSRSPSLFSKNERELWFETCMFWLVWLGQQVGLLQSECFESIGTPKSRITAGGLEMHVG